MLNMASMYAAEESMATITMIKACNQTLVATIRAFDMVVCHVDTSGQHVQLCCAEKEKQMLEIEVQHIVGVRRSWWQAQEHERYQQHRVEMGLKRLGDNEKRSPWDEGMRLSYLERYGGTAYQAQRVKDLEGQRLDFARIDYEALNEAMERRQAMIETLHGKSFASVTITHLDQKAPIFNAVMLTLLHFFLLDCPLAGFTVADAFSGRSWVLASADAPLCLLPASVSCANPEFLPRPVTQVAAQGKTGVHPANEEDAATMRRLQAFGLSDAETETATRRFYSGHTFLQRVLNSPEMYQNSKAVAYACKADINGNENTGRPVFFDLVQVMLNVAIEYYRSPLDEATMHLRDFFTDFWQSASQKTAAFAENETYLCQGMTLVQYADRLKELLAASLGAEEREVFLSTEKAVA